MYDLLFSVIYLESLLASSILGGVMRLLNIGDQWIRVDRCGCDESIVILRD